MIAPVVCTLVCGTVIGKAVGLVFIQYMTISCVTFLASVLPFVFVRYLTEHGIVSQLSDAAISCGGSLMGLLVGTYAGTICGLHITSAVGMGTAITLTFVAMLTTTIDVLQYVPPCLSADAKKSIKSMMKRRKSKKNFSFGTN